uniref:Uncharacterized protein n=1 Tax=Anguilla anguilla TaxID=7936 RepID=A0A0E9WK51_ANGAN
MSLCRGFLLQKEEGKGYHSNRWGPRLASGLCRSAVSLKYLFISKVKEIRSKRQ